MIELEIIEQADMKNKRRRGLIPHGVSKEGEAVKATGKDKL